VAGQGQPGGPLSTLEALRRDAVDALAQRLRDARAELGRRETALRAVQADQLACERRLSEQRALFGAAQSVRALQALELALRALEVECAQRVTRTRRAAQAEQEARAEVAGLAVALLHAERDRRVASRALEDQRLAQGRVSALREEEEADEAFRARR
jgi:flagellar biosynthesis chaperone FliJ